MASLSEQTAIDTLLRNRRGALDLVQANGVKGTQKLLADAARDLNKRLKQAESLSGPGRDSFTATQLRASLAQIADVVKSLTGGLKNEVLDTGQAASKSATRHTVDHLVDLDRFFRGTATQPLALNEASMFEEANQGVRSSILRRLASSGTPPARGTEVEHPHKAKLGILQRYGISTVEHFEKKLRQGFIEKKPWSDIRSDLVAESPFLQQAPAFWATRIVRTEAMGAYNRAQWHAVKNANKQLGDMVKILSATFDDRTGADSYAVHGQIRHPDEPFEWWDGLYMHPPNRPNDREIVTPHRISWPIPPSLAWRSDDEVAACWKRNGRRGAPPERPLMTTIPLERFGGDED